jgi:transcriptional regulator with XRE-family HTH domain
MIKTYRENGWKYHDLAEELGITKGMVQLIERGHKPGPEVSAKLGLEPSAKVLRDRARRKKQRDELLRLRYIWKYEKEILEYIECETIPYLESKGNQEKDIYPISIAKVLKDMVREAQKQHDIPR